MVSGVVTALTTICCSQSALAEAPDMVLPKITDESIQKRVEEFAEYPRAKPRHQDIDTKDALKSELIQKAQTFDYSGSLEKAVLVYDAAIKQFSDPSLRFNRGKLLGRLGKWTAAAEDFKASGVSQVEETAEFCLANGHAEVARLFESELRKKYDKASVLRTISKICMNTGRPAEGRKMCDLAVYLDWVKGDDMTDSLEYYETIYFRCNPRNQMKNNSGTEKLWRTVDDLIERQVITSRDELRNLLPAPISENGYQGSGTTKSVFCYLANDMNAPIRTASFIGGDDRKPHGFCLIPNLLTCCVTPNDVEQFLGKHKFLSERTEINKQNPYSPQEFLIVSKTPWGKLTFWFQNSGHQALNRLDVYFNRTGPTLTPLYPAPPTKPTSSWKEELTNSEKLLQQKKYMQSRSALLNAFALWDGRSDLGGLPFAAEKRPEYEMIKRRFIEFYKQWNRPEVVKFLEATSHWQLAGEVYALIDEVTYDLPKFYDYKNTKWKIKTWSSPESRHSNRITLRIPSCLPRTVSANSPLYDQLMKKLGEAGLLEGETKIDPISAQYLDDEDFSSPPPTSTPAPNNPNERF